MRLWSIHPSQLDTKSVDSFKLTCDSGKNYTKKANTND